ncbi:MAG: Trk system potassium transporter TrkA [Clostridiales bacterium]|jgi:trk system potassium uptake protein TrkA|nr:Trk system potassium transporter TrkA [Clostridiales bacterium]
MKIIIVGDGKVGYSLAETLAVDGNEVTIIDRNMDTLKKTVENLDVMCICGTGVSASILIKSGVKEADLLIAVTNSDEMNMVCCLTAKKLGARHIIARIRDMQYADELNQLTTDLGLDMVINPERAVAREIARILEFPPALKIETFARGRVDMVEIEVTGAMEISDMPLKQISKKYAHSILIGAVLRSGNAIIPNGDFIIRKGDIIYIVGRLARLNDFCRKIGIFIPKVKSAMLIGGGRVAYYLGKYLEDIGIDYSIIEREHNRCTDLAAELPSAIIIHGDGSDDSLLKSENISEMSAFVSVTGHDEDNLISALLAKQFGVSKVIAKISRLTYSGIMQKLGIDNIVNPKQITANAIAQYVRGLENAMGNPVKTLYQIVEGQAEALEFIVTSNSRLINIPLKRMVLKPGVLIAVITRGNNIIIPHGNDKVQTGDSVIVITTGHRFTDLNGILEVVNK